MEKHHREFLKAGTRHPILDAEDDALHRLEEKVLAQFSDTMADSEPNEEDRAIIEARIKRITDIYKSGWDDMEYKHRGTHFEYSPEDVVEASEAAKKKWGPEGPYCSGGKGSFADYRLLQNPYVTAVVSTEYLGAGGDPGDY